MAKTTINPSIGTAAINAMGNVAGALISNISAKKMADKQIQENRRNAFFQRQQEIEDRNYENWYNSPTQEKLRLMDAGLSPAQFFGDTPPSASTEPVDQSHIADPLGNIASIRAQSGSVIGNSISSSVSVLKALSEVNRNNADAGKSGAETQHLERTSELIANNLQLQSDNLAQDIRTKMAHEENLISSAKLNDSERAEHELNYSFLEETYNLRAYQLQMESALSAIQVSKGTWDMNVSMPLEAELKRASIKEKYATVAELGALCNNLAAQTDNFKSITSLNQEELKRSIINTHILKSNEMDTILKNHYERLKSEYESKGEELTNERLEFENKTMLLDFIFRGVSTAAGAYRDMGVGTNQFAGAIGSMITGLQGLPNSNNGLPLWGFGTPNFSK